jgi:hypothetical protein
MSTLENRTKTPDPRFARFDRLHPFDTGADTSEGTLDNQAVEVNRAGQVIGIIGRFTPTMPNSVPGR